MKLIVKLFPEITIKSQSVRLRFIKILARNIRNILRCHDKSVVIIRCWDHIKVRISNEEYLPTIANALTCIPGIHHILVAEEYLWQDMHDIYMKTLTMYRDRIMGKSFCVRVKRRGTHNFTSQDVERYIGTGLQQNVSNTYVRLTNPDETVLLEINQNQLLLIAKRLEGIGGFPIGTQENVLSLISGGFDSSVSSYMLIRRGCRVNYCFFNLIGTIHEINISRVAYHLWHRFGQSHKVRFISCNFSLMLNEILAKVDDSQMGVVLKRMMVRAAAAIAERYGIHALVTGEVLGQVSSQTLTNLNLIDNVSDMLILRPLISHDKEHIVMLSRQIGTEEYAKNIPEYCSIISKNPTVRAVRSRIEQEERKLDPSILKKAVEQAQIRDIRKILLTEEKSLVIPEVKNIGELGNGDVVLDIRAQAEQEECPLLLTNVVVQSIPFYKIGSYFGALDQSKSYLLYCDHGIMSRLQALYLREQGFQNVKVYRP